MSTETKSKAAPKAGAAKTAPKAPAKAEAVKSAPKAEAPKAEAPKAEAPKAEAPKAEAPKAEAPKAEAPKAEAPKTEAPKVEEIVAKAATESYEKVVADTQAQVEKAKVAVTKGYSEFTSMQKDGMDAVMQASRIWAKGAEDIGKAYLSLAKETAQANGEAAKALLAAKSLKEVMDLQNELARKNFDKSLNESAKLSQLSLKVANEAFQPIQKQFTAAFEKARKVA